MKGYEPAFPQPVATSDGAIYAACEKGDQYAGMTLRDWFAGQALVGWISGPCTGDTLNDYEGEERAFAEHQTEVAKTCYRYADAMLAEREKSR